MYARNVSMNLKPNTAREFTQTFEKDILPIPSEAERLSGRDHLRRHRWQGRTRHQPVGSQGKRGAVWPRDLSPGPQRPSESG